MSVSDYHTLYCVFGLVLSLEIAPVTGEVLSLRKDGQAFRQAAEFSFDD